MSTRKAALVTGGGSGISLCLVRILLEKGYNVSILDLSPGASVEITEKPHPTTGAKAVFLKCDITDWSAVKDCFSSTLQEFGRLDVVVNGAGVFEPDWSSFWKPTETSSYKTIDINLSATMYITRLAISTFLARPEDSHGVVVNISSVAGQRATLPTPLYTASKWAVSGFTRSLAPLEESLGIRIAAVAPGIVRTPLWTEEKKENWLRDEDVWVEPEEVAEAMMDLIEGKHGYKGGDILEVTAKSRRLVPEAEPMPSGPGATAANAVVYSQRVLDDLKEERRRLLEGIISV